jgi:hypothetical protein
MQTAFTNARTITEWLRAFKQASISYSVDALRNLIPFTLITLRFVEWWNSSEFPKTIHAKPVPPPPAAFQVRH